MDTPTSLLTNKLTVYTPQSVTVPLYSWWQEVATRRTYVCVRKGIDDGETWRRCYFVEFKTREEFEWDYAQFCSQVEQGLIRQLLPDA